MKKILNHFPWIKDKIKTIYLYLKYIKYGKSYRQKSQHDFIKISLNDEESFFGYYDKFPQQNNNILFYSTPLKTSELPSPNVPLKICIYDTIDSTARIATTTMSYNWQQGCRAHWIDTNKFIYNDFVENSYQAIVFDIKQNRKIMQYDKPVQDSYKDIYFLSLNYRRLRTLRPDYGYYNLPGMSKKELQSLDNDGVWYVDMRTGKSNLLIKFNDIIDMNEESLSGVLHKINHVMISPDGDKFVFMHRWFCNNKKYDRLFLSDLKGNTRLLADYGMVSHYSWVTNDVLFGYMAGPEGNGYYSINVNDGAIMKFKDLNIRQYGDGHPSCNKSGFITDTYPDKGRIQYLLRYSFDNNDYECLGEFFHGVSYSNESRCDLHPRYNHEYRSVFFDSIFTGRRQLYMMGL
ncbi:glycosyl transferase [Seleniivibrio woodruffii]|uniref:Uncharacterized protein n=1 Tax=Seleniivibrio woodruffii TaxID=1078050 RepID=A0A4R1KE62_9BACT|nr:glycosyl transferase [Seleniivibrio woodruffii]TCK62360.1 hypothetical protein C8D98_0885 [Seleniivibrio woodruffii]TVZ34523.1 hypothetical protein OF66_0108 [Seleniivibrio woodruffii]